MSTAREKFIVLLKDDILKLDLAELDFGIYRILNYRRREIDTFLDGELPQRIDAALAKLPGPAGEDEQGRIFHHLYTFFSRYYDDGDFVTRPRRGREAAYSVPYNGQDVHFWWATKGSHYVKSGERFASYVWRDGPRAIRIEVAQADVEKDNVKGAKRYYLPESLGEADGELRLRMAYRPLTADEAKRYDNKRKADADDDDDDDEAIEGRSAQERILNAWLDGAGARKAKIPAGVDRALLKKHVARYMARQSADFFVHPQLGGFLAGELEYYLRHEFLEVWDRFDGDALARERGKFAVVRDIGGALITFLAAIEDVQAQLFEKRKFVLASNWLARVSALGDNKPANALIGEACGNAAQVNEWLAWLGERPLPKSADAKKAATRGAELLAAYPHLCIHTRHFDEGYKYRLLALFDDIEAATGGTLIHSENYAALRTLEYSYRQRIKCIYIDPPYNTGKDGFSYKDNFPHSSWLTMMEERCSGGRSLLDFDGLFNCSIADHEVDRLRTVLTGVFGIDNFLANFIWNNEGNIDNQSKVKVNHEYVLAYCRDEKKYPHAAVIAPDIGSDSKLFNDTIENSITKNGPANPPSEVILPKGFPASFESGEIEARDSDWPHLRDTARIENGVLTRKVRAYSGWSSRKLLDTFIKKECKPILDAKGLATWFNITQTGAIYCYKTRDSQSHVLSVVRNVGTVKQMAGQIEALGFEFDYPKPIKLIEYISRFTNDRSATIADYFAGSGTTAHAVINLNRDDEGARRFVLVEQGEYFDTVLLPRVAKVIACPEWKDGKPKASVAMRAARGEAPAEHWSARSPKLVQVLRLERYEDSLDALELPSEADARRAGQRSLVNDTLLRYVHEAGAGAASVALNTARLSRPFDYAIPQTCNGAPALAGVDLATTALLLLGLHPLRVRDLSGKAGRKGQRYLMIEARPNGTPKETHLLILRDTDDALTGDKLKQHAEAELAWLDDTIPREFGRAPGDYAIIWHNRDAVLSSANARSLDAEVARRMLERAPPERAQ